MSTFEVIGGAVLIFCSVVIIIMVLFQESKGKGLSGVMGGGEMMENNVRGRMPTSRMTAYTKYAAIAFFAVTVIVGFVTARF